jgi:hypothetical protein
MPGSKMPEAKENIFTVPILLFYILKESNQKELIFSPYTVTCHFITLQQVT